MKERGSREKDSWGKRTENNEAMEQLLIPWYTSRSTLWFKNRQRERVSWLLVPACSNIDTLLWVVFSFICGCCCWPKNNDGLSLSFLDSWIIMMAPILVCQWSNLHEKCISMYTHTIWQYAFQQFKIGMAWPCSIKEFSTYHIAPANFTTSCLKEH